MFRDLADLYIPKKFSIQFKIIKVQISSRKQINARNKQNE